MKNETKNYSQLMKAFELFYFDSKWKYDKEFMDCYCLLIQIAYHCKVKLRFSFQHLFQAALLLSFMLP